MREVNVLANSDIRGLWRSPQLTSLELTRDEVAAIVHSGNPYEALAELYRDRFTGHCDAGEAGASVQSKMRDPR